MRGKKENLKASCDVDSGMEPPNGALRECQPESPVFKS